MQIVIEYYYYYIISFNDMLCVQLALNKPTDIYSTYKGGPELCRC